MSLAGLLHRGFGTAPAGPGTPSFSLKDHHDGTVTVDIADSQASSTNTVVTQGVDGELGMQDWIVRGSRTGNGDVTFPLSTGYYWFAVESTLNGQTTRTTALYARIRSGSSAVMKQCLDAVAARIAGLTLDGISSQNIAVVKVSDDRTVALPGIVIAPFGGESNEPTGGTNKRDDVEYPVQVAILAADQQDQSANFNQYLTWREQIARAFRHQRLPGVSEIYTCRVEAKDIVENKPWLNSGTFVSALVLNFCAREPRGLS